MVLIGLSERMDWLQLLDTSDREKNKKRNYMMTSVICVYCRDSEGFYVIN